ncbi:hypothetical protein [Neotabrizicola sp. VNH66]|uniref:hypothetical protein n=1 Tax=Neotabrizicola sp. VNH66 TaxID=3400918 RepID=UPI003BFFCB2E
MDIAGINDKVDLTEGQWVKDIPALPGVELLVRSANFKPYTRARDRALREAAPDTMTDDGLDVFWKITGGMMAEHLLLGWKGVKSGGKDAEFTADQAKALLTADDPHGIGEKFRKGTDYASSIVASRIAAKTETLAGN